MARGGPIAAGGQRQGEALRLIQFCPLHQEKGEGRGDRRGTASGDPPDCVKARRAAAASALAPTFAVLSLLFRDVLRLLRSGLVCTFLSEGECRDMAGSMRPESRTGVLLSDEEKREVMGQLGGGEWTASPRRSGRGDR